MKNNIEDLIKLYNEIPKLPYFFIPSKKGLNFIKRLKKQIKYVKTTY